MYAVTTAVQPRGVLEYPIGASLDRTKDFPRGSYFPNSNWPGTSPDRSATTLPLVITRRKQESPKHFRSICCPFPFTALRSISEQIIQTGLLLPLPITIFIRVHRKKMSRYQNPRWTSPLSRAHG